MENPKYSIRVENYENHYEIRNLLEKKLHYKPTKAYDLANNPPFTIVVSQDASAIERLANDFRVLGATVHVEKIEKRTLKNEVAIRPWQRPTTYAPTQRTIVSEGTLALKDYLCDVFLLEKQLYTYEQISKKYEKKYEDLQEEKGTLYKYEEYRGEITNRSDNRIVFPEPPKHHATGRIEPRTLLEKTPESWHDEIREIDYDNPNTDKLFHCLYLLIIILFGILGLLMQELFIGIIVGLILVAIIGFSRLLCYSKPYEYGGKKYKSFVALYHKKYNEDLAKKGTYVDSKTNFLINEYQESIIPNIQQTQDLLSKIYSEGVIHPKYRNFVAVAQIYEYIDTGRCTELEGPDGAYNLFEHELRLNTIITKLDDIIWQLDRLNNTMNMLVSAIHATNNILSGISSALDRIEANTALTAYNTQCVAYNTGLGYRYNY